MYSTSIRLTTIQGFSPLRSSVAYLFFGGIGLVLLPLTSKLLERDNPGGFSSAPCSSSASAGCGSPVFRRAIGAWVPSSRL
ncbi:hypothetical protein OHO28_48235 [Streptomyces europaeiscabiei]|uniref:hypothetical protein n=1 Tax=Streptomyces europaeiscabiei TaxID=146819 RepID=UPI002E1817D8